ncbi:MAG: diguanylate cyclase [Desulfobacteraceae bacterium 4572_19]|nr:MAG: diguanylate cyclase [Desulfobacteraceae bacterium 4572_19]
MKNQSNYFKIFCKVTKAFVTTLETEKLLDLIVESAIDALDGKAACLFLADESQDIFLPVAQKGMSSDYLHAKPMTAKKLVNNIAQKGFFFFRDATTDPRLENHEAKKAEGIASILTVPVMVSGKVIGILSLYTAKVRDFSKDEIEFLIAMADHGGMAIEKSRLFERLRKNSLLFLELSSSINSTLDIKMVLHILTSEICEVLGMKGVLISLLDQETKKLKLVASYGLSEDSLNNDSIFSSNETLPVNNETRVIVDVTTDDQIQNKEAVVKEGIKSMICAPIKSRDETIGVMKLFSETKRDFPEDLVTMVSALAHQGGLAIQNASNYLKLNEDKKNLEEDIWSHRSWF